MSNGWNTDFNSNNYKVRVQSIDKLHLDIIGVVEYHFIGKNKQDIPEYEWLVHNRKDIAVQANRLGSGGVRLLLAERLLERFTLQVL